MRAGRAAVPGDGAQPGQLLGRQRGRRLEGRGLEVAGGQGRQRVEGQQVRQGAELAVLRGGRAERPRPQVLGGGEHPCGVGRRDLAAGAHRDGLDVLGAEHRTEPAPAGMPAVVRQGRVADAALPRRADGGDPPGLAEPFAHRGLGVRRGPAGLRGGRLETDLGPVDEQHAGPGGATGDDDRVVPGELAGDGEVAGGERVGQQARSAATWRPPRTWRWWSAACRPAARRRTRGAPLVRAGRHRPVPGR